MFLFFVILGSGLLSLLCEEPRRRCQDRQALSRAIIVAVPFTWLAFPTTPRKRRQVSHEHLAKSFSRQTCIRYPISSCTHMVWLSDIESETMVWKIDCWHSRQVSWQGAKSSGRSRSRFLSGAPSFATRCAELSQVNQVCQHLDGPFVCLLDGFAVSDMGESQMQE